MACFVNMLLALLATRTVNLNKLACVVFGDALQPSRYLWENNSDPAGSKFLATNLDEKWKKSNIMFTY